MQNNVPGPQPGRGCSAMSGGISSYMGRLPAKSRAFIQTCVYGLAAGLAAVAFHYAIHLCFEQGIGRAAREAEAAGGGGFGVFLGWTFVVVTATSLAGGILLRVVCPEAAGSGIPQVKIAFWEKFGVLPLRMVFVKFVAGALAVGGGSSLGREGPTVQIGAGLASWLAPLMGVARQNRRVGAAAGAAAGLAAAFNAPLTAIVFVLEEIIEDLNSRLLGSVILASLVGAIVTQAVFGGKPAFDMAEIDAHTWSVYAFVPVVAAFAALCGVGFHRLALGVRARARQWRALPGWTQPVVGAWVTWALGCAVFLATGRIGVFGMGYEDLTAALNNQIVWQAAGLLLAGKLVATAFSYGTGAAGGIFAPTLFLGGMASVFLSGVIDLLMPLSPDDRMLLAVVGLSACLGAVVRAPITSILIVFEMTRQFSLVPSLLLGALVSQWIARTLTRANFYEAVLEQDGHDLRKVVPPRDLHAYRQLPVWTIASLKPVFARSLESDAVKSLLAEHPYNRFPVLDTEGRLAGILVRAEAQAALGRNEAPSPAPAATCTRDATIADVQRCIIDSSNGCIVITDPDYDRHPVAFLTLHDLLRAEAEMGKRLAEAAM